ncbi:MAG TPA: hypothetical protein VGB13_10995 [Candidatus Krumholzibacteria bacterium]
MAKRGPGKFESDLDAALYEMATEGPDAEAGSSSEPPYLWAGLLKQGVDIARAIKGVHESGEAGYEGVDAEDLEFLRTDGKGGVIITENDQGFVETVFYDDQNKLWKDWEELRAELEELEDEEFEENARPGRRRNGEEDILRDEMIEPFLEGKGPVFRIQTWETGKFDQHRLRRDRPMLGYRITMTEPGGRPEVVFEGEDYSPGAGREPDSDQTLNDILAFFTNDYEDESRTERQREIVRKYDDYLSGFFEEREENPRKNGTNAWVVTLRGEEVDIVFFDDRMDADEVKRSLVGHDGYDPAITVKKRRRRLTHAPDTLAENRKWTRAHINDLPDGAFLYIESGGEKDRDGRTTPRTLRHFPYKDASGRIDLPHLRNALSRIPQSSLPAATRERVQKKAREILERQ